MSKILIVDDETALRAGFREYAEFLEFEVTEARDGMEAVALCRDNDFDVIIMDAMMPRMDGFTAIKEIKKIKDIPVLMLSARGEEYDKLFGFEVGVDDYVTKPFSPKEVIARVKVIISRNGGKSSEEDHEVYKFGEMIVDITARSVWIDGNSINLTPREYDLLFYLVKNKNIALSREKILTGVWGFDFYGDDRTVDSHIKSLRMNLGEYKDCVVTLRGVGYRFEDKKFESKNQAGA
ncbi:MAG: response regulator transcription factor [Oscillospiraceae bacterium]|nr:response regulator transcription factor [Oscillospiraceae bacterium]